MIRIRSKLTLTLIYASLCFCLQKAMAGEVIERGMHHLRVGETREWAEFPRQAEGAKLDRTFTATQNKVPYTLRLRQEDVKQRWHVALNGKRLGQLLIDENEMEVAFPIAPGTLIDGQNRLSIFPDAKAKTAIDDIRVGKIRIDPVSVQKAHNDAILDISVVSADSGRPSPARITIVTRDGALQTTGLQSNRQLAVRPGIVYTSSGRAKIGLPAGRYTVFAGRGFEYSLDSTTVTLARGQTLAKQLSIRREVPTVGYVACDTHIHTRTHSGHGDATVEERMITLVGEGIELPIATDHNVHVDHDPFARQQGVRQYFTPVIGNEVTTPVGHFNIFPIDAGAKPPQHRLTDWRRILTGIAETPSVTGVILNHGRDIHSGIRPLGPDRHLALVGENTQPWPSLLNAMEVVNSAATQTDIMQLFHDWMRLLNRGRFVTPVGSSDSHDVGRHFVGQGRTYIRCDDRDPGNIDVSRAVRNFARGHVMVSYGLLAEMTVNGEYRSGDLSPVKDERVSLKIRALGPHWVAADRVLLFANGRLLREERINGNPGRLGPGVKWQGEWTIPKPKHDVHLVAIVSGPGVDGLYWRSAKPYQPTSSNWVPRVIGCSGAIWLDVDGDGQRTPAYEYAKRLVVASKGRADTLLEKLAEYDAAVVVQAAHLYQSAGNSWFAPRATAALKQAPPAVRDRVRTYLTAWRESPFARRAK